MTIEKWVINPGESRVIDLELVRKLKVSLIGGKVDVIAHDEPGARVEVHWVTGNDLKVAIDGDVLEIDHPQLRWDNFIDVFKSMGEQREGRRVDLAPRDVAEVRDRLGAGARARASRPTRSSARSRATSSSTASRATSRCRASAARSPPATTPAASPATPCRVTWSPPATSASFNVDTSPAT